MLSAVVFMSILGFTCSLVLIIASIVFYVEEDPRLEAIKAALPGLNCGGCGFAGCENAAKAILNGKAPITICVGGGPDVVEALALVTGSSTNLAERPTAEINCYGFNRAETLFYYVGPQDCRATAMLYGGPVNCKNGCLGGGTCVSVCPFGAIKLRTDRLPVINASRCRGCGRCVEACPKGVIRLWTITEKLFHLHQTWECLAPCRQKCPAQVNIPAFIRHLLKNDMVAAFLTIKERNPFPLTVGRTCPHPCEFICRRNIADQGVAINHLERFIGEWERNSKKHLKVPCLPDTGRKIAIVGGGPAGLSCAYFLRRVGHQPVIFESKTQLGGMLYYGIPEYRLPKKIVDWEIDGILKLGVEVRTNVKLGRDFTLTELKNTGFEAIFLAIGAWITPHLCIPGENSVGVHGSLDFLSKVGSLITTLTSQKVIVLGESNTAMDCARCCIRIGAKSVHVFCPCERKEMTARNRDVDRALEEGVSIDYMTMPVRVVSNEIGCVTGVEYCRLESIMADSKQKSIQKVSIDNSNDRMNADLIVGAYERKPDLACLQTGEDSVFDFRTNKVSTLDTAQYSLLAAGQNIFAGGDLHTGRSTVISAIAEGRLAARSIHFLLTTGTIPMPVDLQRKINMKSIVKEVNIDKTVPRIKIPEIPPSVRCHSFSEEVIATISSDQAMAEANRCLQCGTTCYDKNPSSRQKRQL